MKNNIYREREREREREFSIVRKLDNYLLKKSKNLKTFLQYGTDTWHNHDL